MSLLQLMGRSGLHLGDDQLHAQVGEDEVSARLQEMEEHMCEVKAQVADCMLQAVILPSFVNCQVKKEQTKLRDEAEGAQLGDVYFCPVIFSRTCNFSASLVRLCRLGLANQTALLQKTGKVRPGSFVTRNLGDLYLIAKSGRDQQLGGEIWLPTWNLRKAMGKNYLQRGYLVWEKDEGDRHRPQDQGDRPQDQGDRLQDQGARPKDASLEGQIKKKERRNAEKEENNEEVKKRENDVIVTRIGRKVKKPERLNL